MPSHTAAKQGTGTQLWNLSAVDRTLIECKGRGQRNWHREVEMEAVASRIMTREACVCKIIAIIND